MKKPALSPLAHAMIRPAESRKPAEGGLSGRGGDPLISQWQLRNGANYSAFLPLPLDPEPPPPAALRAIAGGPAVPARKRSDPPAARSRPLSTDKPEGPGEALHSAPGETGMPSGSGANRTRESVPLISERRAMGKASGFPWRACPMERANA